MKRFVTVSLVVAVDATDEAVELMELDVLSRFMVNRDTGDAEIRIPLRDLGYFEIQDGVTIGNAPEEMGWDHLLDQV